MRKAAVLAHIAACDIARVTTADLLHAATVGGAKALMCSDVGRIAAGRRADPVFSDRTVQQFMPTRNHAFVRLLRAADRAVRDVFVDG